MMDKIVDFAHGRSQADVLWVIGPAILKSEPFKEARTRTMGGYNNADKIINLSCSTCKNTINVVYKKLIRR